MISQDSTAHYAELLEHDLWLAEALCWTVLPDQRAMLDVVPWLGTNVEVVPSRSLLEIADEQSEEYRTGAAHRSRAWLMEADSATMLVEPNGFAGSLPDTLRALTQGGRRASSMYWCGANGANRLSIAHNGEVETIEADAPRSWLHPEELPLLGQYLGPLVAVADEESLAWRAAGLACVELATGVQLRREHLIGPWPMVSVDPWEVLPSRPPGPLGWEDPELALLLEDAAPEALWRVTHHVIRQVAERGGIDTDDVVAGLLRDLGAGPVDDGAQRMFPLEVAVGEPYELPEEGRVDTADPTWRRSQAVHAVAALADGRPDVANDRFSQGLLHAIYAIPEDWPRVRTAVVEILRRPI